MSGPRAHALSACTCIDFVIGRGTQGSDDKEAIRFVTTLSKVLGRGLSLDASFNAAQLAFTPFTLYAQRFDTASFFLPVPCGPGGQADLRPAGEDGQEAKGDPTTVHGDTVLEYPVVMFVTFVREHGTQSNRHEAGGRAVYRKESVSDLQYVNAAKLNKLEWSAEE